MRFGVRLVILAAAVLLVSLYAVYKLLPAAGVDLVVDGWVCHTIGPGITCQIPEDMKPVSTTPIDSMVSQFQSPGLRISFDYGWYSDSLNSHRGAAEYTERTVKISGRTARIVWMRGEDGEMPYVAAVSFRNVSGSGKTSNHLTGWATSATPAGQELAVKVFRTIRFE